MMYEKTKINNRAFVGIQEEEDLINAHRKQVEETMDIVKQVG